MANYNISPLDFKQEHRQVISMLCNIVDLSRREVYRRNKQWRSSDYAELIEYIINNNISDEFVTKAAEMVKDFEHDYYINRKSIIVTTYYGERQLICTNDYHDMKPGLGKNKLYTLEYVPECYERYLAEENIPRAQADKFLTECIEITGIIVMNEYKKNHNLPLKFVYGSLNGGRVIDYVFDVYERRPYMQPIDEDYVVKSSRGLNIELGKKYKMKDSSDICSMMVLLSDNFLKF